MDKRKARRESLLQRQMKSKQKSEYGGLGFFKNDISGVPFWKCEEGDHDIDIIPYVAGPNDPDVKEGLDTYVLEVFEHRDVGNIEGASFICLSRTYKKPCPICEHRLQLIKEGADEDIVKELRVSNYPRSIYNVVVYDTKADEDKGVQVWHTSNYLMEMHLVKLSQGSDRNSSDGLPEYKYFACPEEGYSVRFTRTGTKMNTRYIAHQLVKRNYTIPQAILDQAYQLDTLIHVPTYEEVYAAYWGEEVAIVGTRDNDTYDVTSRAPVADRTKRPSGRSGRVSTKRAPVRTTRPAKAEPLMEDDVDPDELPESLKARSDRVPPAKNRNKRKPQSALRCNYGGVFGQDAYDLEGCAECEVWEACYEQYEKSEPASINDPTSDLVVQEQEQEVPPEPPPRPAKTTRGGRGGRPRKSNGDSRRGRVSDDVATDTPRPPSRPRGRSRQIVS